MEKMISDGEKELTYLINNPIKYMSESYDKAKKILYLGGYNFPENFYQTHRFLSSVSERCGAPFYLTAMNESTEGGVTGPLVCLDAIQKSLNEKSIACFSNGVLESTFNDMCNSTSRNLISGDAFAISDYELCSSVEDMLKLDFDINDSDFEMIRLMTNNSKRLHFKKSLLISEGSMYNIHDAYLYNIKDKIYSGIYHDEHAETTTYYRSIVDYLLQGFSESSNEQLYEAFTTYIKSNDLLIDDGLPYKEVDGNDIIVSDGAEHLIDLYGYNVDHYGGDWDADKNGYPMEKGW